MNNVSYQSPEVSLPRDGGEVLNLKEFRPKNVVLFFYPKDATPTCTKEAVSFSEAKAEFDKLNKTALAEGYEGLMIKPISEGYKCKRSHAWLKVKPFIEVTLKVISLEEGTGKNEGMLGALVVEGEDDGKFFHVNVGSGLSDDMRKDVWAAQDKVIGQLVEVRADAATIGQDSDTWSLRFPRFKTFRGFELGEKL